MSANANWIYAFVLLFVLSRLVYDVVAEDDEEFADFPTVYTDTSDPSLFRKCAQQYCLDHNYSKLNEPFNSKVQHEKGKQRRG